MSSGRRSRHDSFNSNYSYVYLPTNTCTYIMILKADLERLTFYSLYHNRLDLFRLLTSNKEMTFDCHLLQVNIYNERVHVFVTICFVLLIDWSIRRLKIFQYEGDLGCCTERIECKRCTRRTLIVV